MLGDEPQDKPTRRSRARSAARRLGVVGLTAVVVGAPAVAAGAASAATGSPSATVARSQANARTERSVRWTLQATFSGGSVSMRSEAGTTQGGQLITVTAGGTTGHLEIRLVGHTLYVIGDRVGLVYQGLEAGPAGREAGHWLSMTPTSPVYTQTAQGLTVRSIVSLFALSGPLRTAAPATVTGTRVVGIRGTTPAQQGESATSGLLYVRASGRLLPVQLRQTYPGGYHATTTIGDWNSAVSIEVPSGAVPLQNSWLEPSSQTTSV